MTDLVKENINDTILTKDGYHLTQKGGEWAAAQLERAIKRLTAKNEQGTNQGNPPTPPPSTTPTDTATTSNQPKTTPNKQPEIDILQTQVMVIPPGIVKHVIGKKGKVIQEIKKRYNIEIQTATPRDNDETQITIT